MAKCLLLSIYCEGLTNGIIINYSSVKVQNCIFNDIINDGFYSEASTGSCIFANGDSSSYQLTVLPLYQSSDLTFKNCKFGVYTSAMNATITGCRMDAVRTGFYATNTGFILERSVSVYLNTINATKVKGTKAWLYIYSISGTEIAHREVYIHDGYLTQDIYIASLSNGMYIVKLIADGNVNMIKFLKD